MADPKDKAVVVSPRPADGVRLYASLAVPVAGPILAMAAATVTVGPAWVALAQHDSEFGEIRTYAHGEVDGRRVEQVWCFRDGQAGVVNYRDGGGTVSMPMTAIDELHEVAVPGGVELSVTTKAAKYHAYTGQRQQWAMGEEIEHAVLSRAMALMADDDVPATAPPPSRPRRPSVCLPRDGAT